MVEALKVGNDPSKAIEKYITVNIMDEMMARAAHGEMQQEILKGYLIIWWVLVYLMIINLIHLNRN